MGEIREISLPIITKTDGVTTGVAVREISLPISTKTDGVTTGVAVVVEHRPFLTTPISEYNVTEGLIVIIIFVMFLNEIRGMFRRFTL